MIIWYKIMHNFSYEHNMEHNRLTIRALHPKIIGKNHLETNYANQVINPLTRKSQKTGSDVHVSLFIFGQITAT